MVIMIRREKVVGAYSEPLTVLGPDLPHLNVVCPQTSLRVISFSVPGVPWDTLSWILNWPGQPLAKRSGVLLSYWKGQPDSLAGLCSLLAHPSQPGTK